MISCILLTAGESSRFGSPKALANINNIKTIELLQNNLIKSKIHEIIIVTGAHESLIKPYVFNHSKVSLVYNKDYKLGQTSSFQKGLSVVDNNSYGYMLIPIDFPFIKTTTINALILHFQSQDPTILIPLYQGKRGHPPIFHQKLKKNILDLPKEMGINRLNAENQVQTLEVNDPGIIQTFNTNEELEEILRTI
ncbi:MAG: nucleotidyltransferase family protein [Candidatus Omnitrophota bacterium]